MSFHHKTFPTSRRYKKTKNNLGKVLQSRRPSKTCEETTVSLFHSRCSFHPPRSFALPRGVFPCPLDRPPLGLAGRWAVSLRTLQVAQKIVDCRGFWMVLGGFWVVFGWFLGGFGWFWVGFGCQQYFYQLLEVL